MMMRHIIANQKTTNLNVICGKKATRELFKQSFFEVTTKKLGLLEVCNFCQLLKLLT